jgi:hypothetical protein
MATVVKNGELKEKVTFYRVAIVVNTATGEKESSSSILAGSRAAKIRYIGTPSAGASEDFNDDQVTGKAKIEIECRHFTGLRFEDFVVWQGMTFQVYSIQKFERDRFYRVRAEMRDDQGQYVF